jgi:hypothetical protein
LQRKWTNASHLQKPTKEKPSKEKSTKVEITESDSAQPLVTIASRNRPVEESGEKNGKWLTSPDQGNMGLLTPARTASFTPSPAPDDGTIFKFNVSSAASAALTEQKLKRQYALEWEFMATVLDRIMLVFFCGVVAAVTIGMIVIGNIAKRQYEMNDETDL